MWEKRIKKVLLFMVTGGIYILIFTCGYIFWIEYQRSHQDDLSRRLKPDTRWVMNKFPVYFSSGNKFGRINLDGSDLKIFYRAPFPVQEFIFSPNGRYIAIITSGDLLVYDQKLDQVDLVQSLGSLVQVQAAKGLIRGLQWSSDSQKFCYELSRWSEVASADQFYVYGLQDKQKKMIQTSKKFLSVSDLKAAGITPSRTKNFSNRMGQKNIVWNARKGKKLGLDEERCLYYQDSPERRKKLFCLRYDGLYLTHLRWIPSEHFVIMTYGPLGILVIDPVAGKVGRLIKGQIFGWYEIKNAPPL